MDNLLWPTGLRYTASKVHWIKSDEDVEIDHTGVVVEVRDSGRLRVKFPKGAWNFKPRDLMRAHIQPGNYVSRWFCGKVLFYVVSGFDFVRMDFE